MRYIQDITYWIFLKYSKHNELLTARHELMMDFKFDVCFENLHFNVMEIF